MSLQDIDLENIRTNVDALQKSMSWPVDFVTENQAYRIFRNLDEFKARGGNDYEEGVEEYMKAINSYNKSDKLDEFPDIKLVDYDNDKDLDIQLVRGKNVERTYTHENK